MTAGLATLAVRVPGHPVAQALLAASTWPLAAPSANRSGHVSPTTAAHVVDDLGDRVSVILDAGPTPVGLESTIVGLAGAEPVLLRAGGLARERSRRCSAGRWRAPGRRAPHRRHRACSPRTMRRRRGCG